MRIEVNNGRAINLVEKNGGVVVERIAANGEVEERRYIDGGLIITLLNLVEYMQTNERKTVYLLSDYMEEVFSSNIRCGNLEEYKVF